MTHSVGRSALLVSSLVVFLVGGVAAQDRVAGLLERLSNAAGPSGFEEPVRQLMAQEVKPYAARVQYDGLGSLIAVQGTAGPRVMYDAHLDELGGVIRRVTPDGFLTMQMLGGWLDQALVDQRWVILGSQGPVHAVTGIRDIHILPAEERARVFPRDTLFLDVGASSAADLARMGVGPGDPVVPDAPFQVLNGSTRYLGKAWDDRVGCAVMVEAMRRLATLPHANQIFYAATVQEEIGLRGAHAAADLIHPEIGIALEAGITRDAPGVQPEEAQEVLGGGPGLFLYNSSELPNRRLVALVRQVAAAQGIPLQTDLVVGYGDDSAEIQKSNGGVPTVTLVIPTRYTHAHNGIIDRRDFDRMVDLVVALLQKLDARTVAQLRSFGTP